MGPQIMGGKWRAAKKVKISVNTFLDTGEHELISEPHNSHVSFMRQDGKGWGR